MTINFLKFKIFPKNQVIVAVLVVFLAFGKLCGLEAFLLPVGGVIVRSSPRSSQKSY